MHVACCWGNVAMLAGDHGHRRLHTDRQQWLADLEGVDAGLNPPRALWRVGGDVIEDRAKVGKSRKGVAKLHRPCLAHTARTCSSVANSPRAAAAFEAAIAVCSSGVSGTCGS